MHRFQFVDDGVKLINERRGARRTDRARFTRWLSRHDTARGLGKAVLIASPSRAAAFCQRRLKTDPLSTVEI
jgi:hypothetical protein